ncbi:hypothetical protein HK101_000860 [Irineochytrium annulatum]|nr:hypothetical protein HK101_000860 [Irineochytrium annulatum]
MPSSKVPVALPRVFPAGRFVELPIAKSYIAYEDSDPDRDDKDVVLCSPGIGDFRHSYRFLGPLLQARGFRVLAMDLRGVGDSGTGFDSYTIEDVAADMVAILDHEGLQGKSVVIIGNSLSAAAAFTVAAEHQDRVKAVVTLGGFVRDMPADPYFRPLTYVLFNHFVGELVWSQAYSSFFASPPADLKDYKSAMRAKMLSDCGHAGIIGQMCRASKEKAWSKIGDVKCAVLLVMEAKDPDFSKPEEETQFVATNLVGSKKVKTKMIEGAGHYAHVEKVEETASAILEFLSSC